MKVKVFYLGETTIEVSDKFSILYEEERPVDIDRTLTTELLKEIAEKRADFLVIYAIHLLTEDDDEGVLCF